MTGQGSGNNRHEKTCVISGHSAVIGRVCLGGMGKGEEGANALPS